MNDEIRQTHEASESREYPIDKHEISTAILVDGGFYRRRAIYYWGEKSPEDRANELFDFCTKLLHNKHERRNLYRIFYYDCPPIENNVFNPITHKQINLSKTYEYKWTMDFFQELRHKRKMALRLGKLSTNELYYNIKPDSFKKLMNGSLKLDELSEADIQLNVVQKGVDMRIGVDISSLTYKKQVQQIILISGDSDFVPAAKQARREGIDFILAPMGQGVKADLFEHIDGLINRPTSAYIRKKTTEK